jgi:transketolase
VDREEQALEYDGRHRPQQHPDRRHDGGHHAARVAAREVRGVQLARARSDGNNVRAFIEAVDEAKAIYEKPTVIIAHTIPGKGVPEIEFDYRWHGKPPTKEEGKKFLKEIRTMGGKRPARIFMINPAAKLKSDVFDQGIEQKPTRDGFGHGTVEAGQKRPERRRVVR